MDGHMYRLLDGLMYCHMDGPKDGYMNGQMYGLMGGQMDGQIDRWMLAEWTNVWKAVLTDGQTDADAAAQWT